MPWNTTLFDSSGKIKDSRLSPFNNQGIQFIQNTSQNYDRATHTVIPNLFGDGEFTLDLVIEPSQISTIGQTASNPGQFTNWANETAEPGSSATWWQRGNWLLDGHNNANNSAGSFDLVVYNSGIVRWLFGDGDANIPIGGVWGIQNTNGTNILTPGLHHVTCVRRWSNSPANSADLELWVNGVLQATVNTGSRTNMATAYWDNWTGYTAGQGNWMWGSEKFAAAGGDWADYKGMLRSLAFFNGAKSSVELASNYANAVDINHVDYIDHFAFKEGSGVITSSEVASIVMALTNPGNFWP